VRYPQAQVLGVVRLLRVQNWFYLLGISVLALARHPAGLNSAVQVLLFSSVYLAWGYVFNNLFDQDEDSETKNPFKGLSREISTAVAGALSLALLGLALAWGLFVPTGIVMILNALYSVPPVRMKENLALSLFCNGIFFGFVYYSSVALLTSPVRGDDLSVCLLVFLIFLPLQYVHFLEHREVERKETRLGHKLGSVLFFALLGLITNLSALPLLQSLSKGTLIYALVSIGATLYPGSAGAVRVRIRWTSLIFGIYLLSQLMIR
jgi:4-hydroxybenzoate polyprenyltransferase